tara:strand:- start:485 stop:604 length:120 start_codon:yes stop_codon:yes gene_type:complete
MEHKEFKEPQDHRVIQALKVQQDHKGHKAQQEHKEDKEI